MTPTEAGKDAKRAPPLALSPCWFWLVPWPALYLKVMEPGRFLLLRSQIVHWMTATGAGGGGGGGTGQLVPVESDFVIVALGAGQQP